MNLRLMQTHSPSWRTALALSAAAILGASVGRADETYHLLVYCEGSQNPIVIFSHTVTNQYAGLEQRCAGRCSGGVVLIADALGGLPAEVSAALAAQVAKYEADAGGTGRSLARCFGGCTPTCLLGQAELYAEIQGHNARVGSAVVCKAAHTPEVATRYSEARERLREKWKQLWAECNEGQGCNIGVPPGIDASPTVSGRGPCKTAILAELRDTRDRIKKDLNELEAQRERYSQVCNYFGVVSTSISAGVDIVEGGVEFDLGAICQAFKNVDPDLLKARKDSVVAAERAVEDPPSQDYLRVVQPRIEQLPVPPGASPLERRAYEAVQAQRGVAAYIGAYVDAFERYQGAEAANNGQAMREQARAMSGFAGLAKTSSRETARGWHDFDRSLFAAIERWSRARGLTGREGRRAALPDEIARATEALERSRSGGGVSESDAASARRGIEFVLGAGCPAFLDEGRLRLGSEPRNAESQFCDLLLQLSRGVEELLSLRLELPQPGP